MRRGSGFKGEKGVQGKEKEDDVSIVKSKGMELYPLKKVWDGKTGK